MSLIVSENEHLLVVNKPAGWNTHAPAPFAGEGVYDWLRHREPRWAKLAIVHRLDKETSGLLVFGKTSEANRSLTRQFTERSVEKTYVLLTDRVAERDEFTVVSAITRAGEKYTSRPVAAGGERAETRFSVLRRERDLAWVEAAPVTGRTHQIRVHAAEQGMPILGDTLYGGTAAPRVYLHAAKLAFAHPVSGEKLSFEVPPDWSAEILSVSSGTRGQDVRAPLPLRQAVVDPQLTDSLRLIHGASDGWPGVYIDKLGAFLLVQSERELAAAELRRIEHLAEKTGACGVYGKHLERHVRRTTVAEASPQPLLGAAAPERFTIRENDLRFELSFAEGYSVGLFLDQRDNRRRLLTNHVGAEFGSVFSAPSRPAGMLNVFSYTCGFSVAAAKAGVRTTSLDLSRKYLEWGKRNFALNEIDPAGHDFIYGDAFDWLRRLAKKGRQFDCIALDPPTFSQSKESGTWRAEKDYGKLVEVAWPLLAPDGVLFASTNAARLEPAAFLEAVRAAVVRAGGRVTAEHYVPQPPDFPISRAEPAYLKTVWMRVAAR